MNKLGNIIAGSLLLIANVSIAGEIDMLVDRLAEKGVITYGEAQQIKTETKEDLRTQIARGKAETMPQWIQNLSVKGDIRVRHQADWDAVNSFPRIRERLRLRAGFDTRIIDTMSAGFGFATGGETISSLGGDIYDKEPTSTNHTFGNGFGKPRLMVDYAFVTYAPYSWVSVTAGKFKAGKQVWNPTDLLWDTDINPDGVAVNVSRSLSSTLGVFFNGSWLVFNESNAAANDPDACIAQPGISWKPTENIALKAAVAYQQLNVGGKNTVIYGTPAFDYVAINPSLNVAFNELVGPYSLGLFGDTVANTDAKPAADTAGNAFGASFGHAKVSKFGEWQVKYIQRRLESNAWLNKLGDSDAYGGAVNSRGYEVIATLGLTPSASLGIDYYSMDKITGADATTPRSLLQIDIACRF